MAAVGGAVTTNEATPLCEARRVSHSFRLPNGQLWRALSEINLVIKPREVLAVLGPSGCGKSTLLRILAGLVRPSEGELFYQGRPLHGPNPAAGVVFQSFALYPWLTVTQNVEAVLQAAGLDARARKERAAAVLDSVALGPFAGSYPRELSGGMKQRVGIARALAINPEILLMDEPFSQIDALTAESLRAELVDLWTAKDENPSSIFLVSHDIKEVAYMADRIVLMAANPGRVLAVLDNRLPRPRDYRSPEFLRLVDGLHDVITGHVMPDLPPGAGAEANVIEPLANATPGEIIGLLEYLDARGGKEDIFRIATDTNQEFGHVITVVKAVEMLDFVDTPRRQVVLVPNGKRFVNAPLAERKVIWREQLLKLRLFREVRDMIARHPEATLDADVVLEAIILAMPYENYENTFTTLVRWARFGELFTFDEDRHDFSRSATARFDRAAPEKPASHY